jgi:hypothetical protein
MEPNSQSANLQVGDTAVGEPQAITRIVATRHHAGTTYSLAWTRCGKAVARLCQQYARQRYGHGRIGTRAFAPPGRGGWQQIHRQTIS